MDWLFDYTPTYTHTGLRNIHLNIPPYCTLSKINHTILYIQNPRSSTMALTSLSCWHVGVLPNYPFKLYSWVYIIFLFSKVNYCFRRFVITIRKRRKYFIFRWSSFSSCRIFFQSEAFLLIFSELTCW